MSDFLDQQVTGVAAANIVYYRHAINIDVGNRMAHILTRVTLEQVPQDQFETIVVVEPGERVEV